MLQSKSGSTGDEFQKRKDEVIGESKENIKEAEETLKVIAEGCGLVHWLGTTDAVVGVMLLHIRERLVTAFSMLKL